MARQRRSKYTAIPTTVDGIRFDSRKEAQRWGVLRLLQMGGKISGLRRQVPYPLTVGGVLICTYYADFVYVEHGNEVVEDAKGFRTEIYRLKRKLMKALYGIDIRES